MRLVSIEHRKMPTSSFMEWCLLEREQLPTALGEEMGVLDEVGGVDALNPY
jgi:hypothetical protein